MTGAVGFLDNTMSDFTVRNGDGDLILLAQDTRITGLGSTNIGDVTPSSIKLDVRGANVGNDVGDSTHALLRLEAQDQIAFHRRKTRYCVTWR